MNKTMIYCAVLTSLILTSCDKKTENKVSPVKVETETVTASTAVNGKGYVGIVEEESSTAVSFNSSGMLLKVYVDEGQHIHKGQLIARMDPTQCKNALANCTAQMNQANDALVRMKQLHDNNSLADMKWVEVQSQVAQAKAQLDMARKALDDCDIYSPINGFIGKKKMNSGEMALPSMPVCTILNINNVKIKVSVPEKEIAKITDHTKSTISVAAIGRDFTGGKIEKGVQADEISRSYDIKINVSNPKNELLPGMVCSVKMENMGEQVEDVEQITVPITAVQQSSDNNKFVWENKDGKAHRVNVILGETVGNRITIVSGLKKGDIVIVKGYQKLGEGTKTKN